jgi:hypothetical protein
MTDSQSSQSIVPNAQTEPLRETLRLACDLADALASQTERARRQASTLSTSPLASSEMDRLMNQASRVSRQCADLLGELDTIDSAGGHAAEQDEDQELEQDGAPALVARKRFSRSPRVDNAAIQTLAIDLKMGGLSREEIERTLVESFGVAGAAEIVDGVFDGAAA